MKLLELTARKNLLFAAALLILCTPLLYFAVTQIITNQLDRELVMHRHEFDIILPHLKNETDISFLHLMNKEFFLSPSAETSAKDTIYSEFPSGNLISYGYQRVLQSAIRVSDQPYTLFIREAMIGTSTIILSIACIQLLLLLSFGTGLVLINRSISKSVMKPFYSLLDSLRHYQIDKHNTPTLPHSVATEFRELNSVVTDLINKNHDAFLSQKEFTENASHELQTPLSICRNKMELLAQTAELTSEQSELVSGLLQAADRISKLNKDLLLLSRIENQHFLDTETIALKPIIDKAIDTYTLLWNDKQLDISINHDEDATLIGNHILIDSLLSNLISNALKHSPPNGRIRIQYDSTYFVILNSGQPLEHPEKLFNRFHRESRTSSGSGLGLSIVKKISDVTKCQIEYTYFSNMHQFEVVFSRKK